VQPTDPDENPTQRLDDIRTPGPGATTQPDMVDSATATVETGGRRGLGVAGVVGVVGVVGAVLALVAAGAVGALLAGGGGDGATTLTGIGATSDGNGSDEDRADDESTPGDRMKRLGRGAFGHGMGGPGLVGGMFGRGLHGSFVVEDPDGGYQTVLTQQGTATVVSDASITVKSADGFVATYRLTDESSVLSGPSGTDAIDKGADVAVTAVETGSTARAVHVIDLSQIKDRFEHRLEGGPGSPDDDEDTPRPSSTSTSGASV
jgi:hypothetical protein